MTLGVPCKPGSVERRIVSLTTALSDLAVDSAGIFRDESGAKRVTRHLHGARLSSIFVVDGDMTSAEIAALSTLAKTQRPLLLALNKADRYTDEERERLLERLNGGEKIGFHFG